jgi:hypothetical protein
VALLVIVAALRSADAAPADLVNGPPAARGLLDGIDGPLAIPAYDEATPAPRVLIVRDPFSPTPRDNERPSKRPEPMANIPVLPPNAGASAKRVPATPSERPPEPRVQALAVGPRRYALVSGEGATLIVTVGDVVSGRRVTRITQRGVAFDDGTSIHLETGL